MSRESLIESGALAPEAQYTPTVSAICGLPLSGQAITGVIIVPAGDVTLVVGQPPLALGARAVAVHADAAPLAVAKAGLVFGARPVAVHVDITAVVGRAGLTLSQRVVGLKITTTLHVAEGPLALGVYPHIFAGQVWIFINHCQEEDLELASDEEWVVVLAPVTSSDLDLDPVVCR